MAERAEVAGLRVLLADASDAGLAAMKAVLDGAGCHCDLATDGAAAVERAASRLYDLILVDLDLPVLNGAQCRQAIAGLPGRHGQAPVVAVAAADAADARLVHLRAEGFAALLRRPIAGSELLACLATHAAPGSVSEPAIDLEHLRRYTLGEVSLERELLQAFLPNAAGYLAQMAAADDTAAWRQSAHALKGAARGIGAFSLGDLAERAEDLADADAGVRRRLLDELRRALAQVERFVAAHLA